MNFRKSLTLLVGSTSALMIAGLVIVFGLCVGVVLLRHLFNRPGPSAKLVPKRPVIYVTFAPTTTSAANVTPTPSQTALPVAEVPATSADVSMADTNPAADAAAQPSADTAPPANNTGARVTTTPTSPLANASSPGATPTLTLTPNPSGTPTATPTSTPTPTLTPTSNSTTPQPTPSSSGQITGSLLLDGSPAAGGVKVKLEDQTHKVVAETTVGADGLYTFPDLSPSSEGYTLLFAREWNSQYEIDEVISWGWLGPIAVEKGANVELPDFDISLLGFEQVNPEPNADFSAVNISAANPVQFKWTAYPGAAKYWIDLVRGEEQNVLWQSGPVQTTSFDFDGTVGDGTHIQPNEYWWGVGAWRELGSYKVAVYGYLPVLRVTP
jgi:hypothetical protein